MPELILHEATARTMERFLRQPAHALLVAGPAGIGKKAIVRQLAARLLELTDEAALDTYPYLYFVAPPADKAGIGIEAVRELQQAAKLKLPAGTRSRRLFIIHDGHTLTTEAQNALLKLLEEPPADTHIIITASDEQALLPTIRSRTQGLPVRRPPRDQLDAHFAAEGHDATSLRQAYMLSGGLPGLEHALLSNGDHPLKRSVQLARTVLQGTTFQRLCTVDEISKKRPECLQLIFALRHMAQAAIEQAATQAGDPAVITKRLKQWHHISRAAYQAEQSLQANAQPKLVLDYLMLSL